jgi:glycosyltransferase involved in cell wall biosynthesis
MPLVSIVIATYNRVHLLREAIQSALVQTFSDFELIVCDDGALKETKDLCESFNDTRIKHIVNPLPLGISMNTYSGVVQANTNLIAFLNDDDRWLPEFLSSCAEPMLSDDDIVLSFSDHWIINSSGERLVSETERNSIHYGRAYLNRGCQSDPMSLLGQNAIPLAMASVFRKSAVDWSRYSEKVGGAYDRFISYCLIISGGKVFYFNERLTEYRVHAHNASGTRGLLNALERVYVNETILNDPRCERIASKVRNECSSHHKQVVKGYLRQFALFRATSSFAAYLFGRSWHA